MLTRVELGCFLPELHDVVLRGGSEDVVSLCVEVVEDLAVDPGVVDACARVEPQEVQVILGYLPFVVELLLQREDFVILKAPVSLQAWLFLFELLQPLNPKQRPVASSFFQNRLSSLSSDQRLE